MSASQDRLTLRLARAIAQQLDVLYRIEHAQSDSWASATFAGATHYLVVTLEGADAQQAADRIGNEIADVDYELRGHIVADIAVAGRERCDDGVILTIEALTIVDA